MELLSLSVTYLVVPLRLCFLLRTDLLSFASLDYSFGRWARFDPLGFRIRRPHSVLIDIRKVVTQLKTATIRYVPILGICQGYLGSTCTIGYYSISMNY